MRGGAAVAAALRESGCEVLTGPCRSQFLSEQGLPPPDGLAQKRLCSPEPGGRFREPLRETTTSSRLLCLLLFSLLFLSFFVFFFCTLHPFYILLTHNDVLVTTQTRCISRILILVSFDAHLAPFSFGHKSHLVLRLQTQ